MIIVALREWLVSMGSLVNDVLKIRKKIWSGCFNLVSEQ